MGDAVHHIPFGSHASPDRPGETEHYLKVELDRDTFLAWDKLKASVRDEVRMLPQSIELCEHLEKVAHAVEELNITFIAQQVFELQGHAHRVIDLARPLKAQGGTPIIVHLQFPDVEVAQWGSGGGSIEQIPLGLAEFVASPPRDVA